MWGFFYVKTCLANQQFELVSACPYLQDWDVLYAFNLEPVKENA